MDSTAGTRLGHYRVVSLLGRGGMGEVYAADDENLRRRIALKMHPVRTGRQRRGAGKRFRREARSAATINHPNVVTVHSIEEADGTHFLTMELVEGSLLSDLVQPGGRRSPACSTLASRSPTR